MPEDNPTILRICRGLCGQEKPLDQFPLTRGRRFYRCATCVLAQNLAYQRAHKERYGEIKRAWIERNPEKHKAALARCAAREESKTRLRRQKQERREQVNAQTRESYAKNPKVFKDRLARREQREAQAEGVFTADQQREMFIDQGGLCGNPACRVDLRTVKYHADHILALVHGGTHWPYNRQLLCFRCNHIKGARKPEEWMAITQDPRFQEKWGRVQQ